MYWLQSLDASKRSKAKTFHMLHDASMRYLMNGHAAHLARIKLLRMTSEALGVSVSPEALLIETRCESGMGYRSESQLATMLSERGLEESEHLLRALQRSLWLV